MCILQDPPQMPPAPVPPQDAKMPDTQNSPVEAARRRASMVGGPAASTLLTGPSGVENSALSLGRTTLLGQ